MEILYILLVLLVVTRAFGEIAERCGQPALVGELLSGIALGVVVARFSETFPVLSELTENPVFRAVTDLGVFFLMLYGGVVMRPKDLAKASASSFFVAVCGLFFPLALGFWAGWSFLPDSDYRFAQSLFIGTALSITAVPVAIRVLMDLGKLESQVGRTIVSAAVFDDVLSLILLAALTAVAKTGELPEVRGMLLLGGNILLFFVISFLVGQFVFPHIGKLITRFQADEFELTVLLVFAMGFAMLAEALHLHFILGAFMAGLFFGRRSVGNDTYETVKSKVSGITTGFLAPVFFASIGLHLDTSAVLIIPGFLAMLVTIAFLSKMVGAGLSAYWTGLTRKDSLAVGIGMSARGAVELIIADIALRAGLFDHPKPPPPIVVHLFSAIVIVAVLTTIAIPIALRRLFANKDATV
ncbi:MAG: cation:proton antiporter [Pirellulaceae bacterium]